jgi:hypothetical protein
LKTEVLILPNGADPEKLNDLFLEGVHDLKATVFQSRQKDPYRMWRSIENNRKSEYIVLKKGSQFIGCTARVEHSLSDELSQFRGFIDSDLFISPQFRSLNSIKSIVEARFHLGIEENNTQDFYWGVEHEPRNLNLCSRLAPRYNVSFDFLMTSTLFQIPTYLKPAKFTDDNLQCIKLSELNSDEIGKFQKIIQNSENRRPSLPSKPQDFLSRLAKDEDESWLVFRKDLSAGVLLSSFRSSRKWLATGKIDLEMEKLRRARAYQQLKGQEIKYLMLGAPWGNPTEIERLIVSSVSKSHELNFDYLVYRDLLKPSQIPQIFEFPRRVFFIYHTHSEFKKVILKNMENLRIETFFV